MKTFLNPDKTLVFWNKLGSTQEVENSEIGSNGTESGTITYSTGKYGNGADTGQSGNKITVPAFGDTLKARGTIEAWWHPTFSNTWGSFQYLFSAGSASVFGIHQIYWRQDYQRFSVQPQSGTAFNAGAKTFNNDTWYHMAVCWDESGIDGTAETIRFYIDNFKEASKSVAMTDSNWDGHLDIGFRTQAVNRGSYGVMDNFKIWNYAKTDFADRLYEYPSRLPGSALSTYPFGQLNFWNKLGSLAEATNSEVGPNCTETGTATFAACKYGNGNTTDTTANYLTFPYDMSVYSGSEFTLEWWWKPDYDYDDGTPALNIHYFMMGSGTNDWFRLMKANTPTETRFISRYKIGSNKVQYFWDSPVFSAGDLLHMALVVSSDAGNGNRLKLYINGNLIPVESSPVDTTWTNTATNWIMYIGKLSYSPAWHDVESAGPVDNFKIWNYPKTDFSHREREYPGLALDTANRFDPYKNLVLWNKLGSTTEVTNSEVGPNGEEIGTPTYSAGKFGNGTTNAWADGSNYVRIPYSPAAGMPTDNFTFECWWKPDYDSDDTTPLKQATIMTMGPNSSDFMHIAKNFHTSGLRFYARVKAGGSNRTAYYYTGYPAWTAGDNIHIGAVYESGAGTGEKLRLYVNGTKLTSAPASDTSWTFSTSDFYMYPGSQYTNLGGNGTLGVVDNVKIYDYKKTDFTDALWEIDSFIE